MRSSRLKELREFDAVIIGAGLAGLHTAKRLSAAGASVLLVDRKEDPGLGVHTTGIFVRKTFEDFSFPEGCLGVPITRVSLYSPSLRKIDLESRAPEFRIGRMDRLYRSLLEDSLRFGAEFIGGARFAGSLPDPSGGGSIVRIEKAGAVTSFRTQTLIGADGVGSAVARDLGLETNEEWIVGYEKVFRDNAGTNRPAIHCFLNAELAPGYIAWVASDGAECHIGVGGYPDRFRPQEAFGEFLSLVDQNVIDLSGLEEIESRGGRIPVGGILRKISNRRGLLIGDAAGAVSPLTAGGLDPCLRLSDLAADIVLARLRTDDPDLLLGYSGRIFEMKFRPKLIMRALLRALKFQAQYEWLFSALASAPGRFLAEKIFYRRASFPDIGADHPIRKSAAEGLNGVGK